MPGAEKFIQRIAREAGETAWKLLGKEGIYYMKSERLTDAVTKADLFVESIILSNIRKRYPNHGILAEESGELNHDAEYVWTIDPIDGTLNFASSIPIFGTMIALTRNGKAILSAIYLPSAGELFFAKAGHGAFCNHRTIHCSKNRNWFRSAGCSNSNLGNRAIRFLRNFLRDAYGHNFALNSYGSVAAVGCYVAAGRRDWQVSFGANSWDYAPVSLILKEAGCKVTNGEGKPWKIGDKELIAANPYLHKKLLKLVKGI